MNPFVSFCLFVAARTFIVFLKKMPDDQEVRASLEFLCSALQALKRRNPISESFLLQLWLEIKGTRLENMLQNADFSASMKGTVR